MAGLLPVLEGFGRAAPRTFPPPLVADAVPAGSMVKAVVRRAAPSCAPMRPLTVTQLLLDVSLARLVLTLAGALLAPFRTSARWAAWVWQLAAALRRFVLRLVGYMAAPPRHPALRHLGGGALDVRRWHLAAGAPGVRSHTGRRGSLFAPRVASVGLDALCFDPAGFSERISA